MISSGTILTLTPHDLSVDGGSVARHDDMIVFLDAGLPGEQLRARVTRVKARFANAEVVETLTPSPLAVPPYCTYAGVCGGCAWPTLPYDAELAWKEKQVQETFRRLGKVDFEQTAYGPILPSPRDLAYRNKVEFAFGSTFEPADNEDAPVIGNALLGFKRRASHEIVEVADCPLAAAPAHAILTATRAWALQSHLAAWNGKQGYLRFLVLRRPEYAPEGVAQCLVELITAPSDPPRAAAVKAFAKQLQRECPEVTGFIHSERASLSNVAYGERVRFALGPDTLHEQIGPLVLEASTAAFVQVNTPAAALLYAKVKELAALSGTETVWDLYCGVGGIALFLADAAQAVRGFESETKAVAFAKRNAVQAGGRNVRFASGDVAALLKKEQTAPDLVVTDPPRAGLDSRVTDELLRLAPPRIILVGCDPATMARDAARLAPRYQATRIQSVDLFPHTPHVETVAVLQRQD